MINAIICIDSRICINEGVEIKLKEEFVCTEYQKFLQFAVLGAVCAFAPVVDHAYAVAANPSDTKWVCSKCGVGPFKCHPNFLDKKQVCKKGGYHEWKEVK